MTKKNSTALLLVADLKLLWYISDVHPDTPTLFCPHFVELRGIRVQLHVDGNLFWSNLILESIVRAKGEREMGDKT